MSGDNGTPDRVSNKDLYETLKDFPTRRELRLTVGLALIGGQLIASLVTAFVTRMGPAQQASALYHIFF